MAAALVTGFPTNLSEKKVVIIPADRDDLKPAETFYSGYSTAYPILSSGGYGYGWRGDHKPVAGPVYGSGYEIGYTAVPLGSYGAYVPGTVVVGGGPLVPGGGGYGWRQGVNRWAL